LFGCKRKLIIIEKSMVVHVDSNHSQWLRKKWARPFGSVIIAFFGSTNPYKHGNEPQQRFLENFMLHICER
jgi:hypothetical protein